MTTVTKSIAPVYLAPTRGRRFLTLDAAIEAEARDQLNNEHNSPAERDGAGRIIGSPDFWEKYAGDQVGGALTEESISILNEKIAEIKAEYKNKKPLRES